MSRLKAGLQRGRPSVQTSNALCPPWYNMRRPRIGIWQRPRRAGSVGFPVTAADCDALRRPARRFRQSVAILLFAAIVRGLTLWAFPAGLERDVDGYRQLAENLRRSGMYGLRDTSTPATVVRPTAFRPPLYPLLLTALVRADGLASETVAVAHAIIGLATVGCVLALARRWQFGSWSAVPALLVACDPILLHQSTQVMTETLATLTAVGGLLMLTRFAERPTPWLAACTGASLGVATLCRPTFLPWTFLCVLAVAALPSFRSRRWANVLAMTAGTCVLLTPWGVRNYVQLGQFQVTTTHGGYTLLLGNNPSYYGFLRERGSHEVWSSLEWEQCWQQRDVLDDPQDPRWSELLINSPSHPAPTETGAARSEVEEDRFAYALAGRFIREQPRTFAYACLVRICRLWGLRPRQLDSHESVVHQTIRYATAAWYVAVYGLCIVGMVALRDHLMRPPWAWGLLMCLAFTAVHTVYWTDLRMRAPLIPFLGLLAGWGLARMAASGPEISRTAGIIYPR